jgi:hypothetical protein
MLVRALEPKKEAIQCPHQLLPKPRKKVKQLLSEITP